MPRNLSDVIHYWLPESQAAPATQPAPTGRPTPVALHAPAVLPVACAPVGERDVLRAALLWNLTVEIARLGGRAVLVTPEQGPASPLQTVWPAAGVGPVGAEIVRVPIRDVGELHRCAFDVAVDRAADALEGGIVLVQLPPRWLLKAADAGSLLRWTLLFATAASRDLLEAYGLAKLLRAADPAARVGVTLHGVRGRREAEHAFARLAAASARHLDCAIASYGMLVDDLDVYRAIVAQRPIGLAHPHSPAARSLRDVASLLLGDARERALG